MRIRKRQVPLPLSSLSPVPLSDPHLCHPSVVQLHLHNNNSADDQNLPLEDDDTAAYFDPQPSDDHQPSQQPIRSGQIWSDGGGLPNFVKEEGEESSKDFLVLMEQGERERGGEGEKNNNDATRKGRSSFLTESETSVILQQSSSFQVVGIWCQGEKAFPLKKRRGSFERKSNEEMTMEIKDKKMKTKMNKKCVQVQQNINNEEEPQLQKETKDIIDGGSSGNTNVKKRSRGGALMEGSRCSRVNGRGWRCCQQTLVGYSLCEHHLGKGRLRSMTSVRSRSMANTSTATKKAAASGYQHLSTPSLSFTNNEALAILSDGNKIDGHEDEDHKDDEKKLLTSSKRKMKLGVVKARSISSLLGQANGTTSVAAERAIN